MCRPSAPFLLFALVFLCASCRQPANDGPTPSPVQAPVPAAFDDGGALESVKEISSRGYDENAVDKLFAEVLEKDTGLAGLLDRWVARMAAHAENQEPFNGFNGNNLDYYTDAGQKTGDITDTALAHGMMRRLGGSQARYEAETERHRLSIAQHQAVARTGNDLVRLIALERTLDVVETYQRENLPDRRILDADLAELIRLRDQLRAELAP